MKKIVWILMVIIGLWLSKLSYDVYTMDKNNVADLNTQILQQNQKIANLNDQIIALKQATSRFEPASSSQQQPVANIKNEVTAAQHFDNEKLMVKDRLDLINVFVQQKQFDIAVEQIQQLRQKLLNETLLSESVNSALIEALAKDQSAIGLYIQQRNEHQVILQQELQQIDGLMYPQPLVNKENNWKWSSWLTISRAQSTPDYQNRELVYQEQRLKLLLAQQALAAGQTNYYYAQIQQIQNTLAAYPEPAAKLIVTRLNILENKQLIAPPTLSALVLVEGTS